MAIHRLLPALLTIGAAFSVSAQTPPAPPVTEVIVLDAATNVPKVVDLLKRGGALSQKLGARGNARLFVSRWAGSESGSFLIAIEHPSIDTLAQDSAKQEASAEWQKFMTEVRTSGVRTLSQSLYIEVPGGPPGPPAPTRATGGPNPVLLVVQLEGGSNPEAAIPRILDVMRVAAPLGQKLGLSGRPRVWSAAFAGPETGRFAVVIESPSFAAFVADGAKQQASAEWGKVTAAQAAAGLKVLSTSIFEEIRF